MILRPNLGGYDKETCRKIPTFAKALRAARARADTSRSSGSATHPACARRPARSDRAQPLQERRKPAPWNALTRSFPPGFRCSRAKSSASSPRCDAPRLVAAAIPDRLGDMSESTRSTRSPPSACSTSRSTASSLKSPRTTVTPGTGAISSRSTAIDLSASARPSRAATCDQPPGAAPRSTTLCPAAKSRSAVDLRQLERRARAVAVRLRLPDVGVGDVLLHPRPCSALAFDIRDLIECEPMPKASFTPAERQTLRARAHRLDPVVMIGDDGLTPPVLAEIERALKRHELIKIRVLGDDRDARERLLGEICAATDARRCSTSARCWSSTGSDRPAEQPEQPAAPPRKQAAPARGTICSPRSAPGETAIPLECVRERGRTAHS